MFLKFIDNCEWDESVGILWKLIIVLIVVKLIKF